MKFLKDRYEISKNVLLKFGIIPWLQSGLQHYDIIEAPINVSQERALVNLAFMVKSLIYRAYRYIHSCL